MCLPWQGHGPGGDLRKLLKQRLPTLLRLLLGAKTNVVAVQVGRGHCPLPGRHSSFPHQSLTRSLAIAGSTVVEGLESRAVASPPSPPSFLSPP